MNLIPVTLTGSIVRLEPLDRRHLTDLTEAGNEEQIWEFMRYGLVNNEEKMLQMIEMLLEHQAQGTDLPFTVLLQSSGKAIGMTRYMNIEVQNRALEIGGTWYAADYQRTGVNTECKYLLFQYAFEQLGCLRVQIKTDLRNVRSQRAIERLGAVREGVLRNHMVLPDGIVRSSVYYSVLAREWPEIKQHLLKLMNRSEAK
jgi:N-acetyltransferase